MTLTKLSLNRLKETAVYWRVPNDFYDPLQNYLVHGWEPGSCFSAVLANDFFTAIQRSHPSNTVEAFKATTGWINDCFPKGSWGSYQALDHWIKLTDPQRRHHLEESRLIYTEQEEIMRSLRGESSREPLLY
jgi:hypothetical protein